MMTMLSNTQKIAFAAAAITIVGIFPPVAQGQAKAVPSPGTLSVAVTYDALASSDIAANHALLQGGAVDIAATTPFHGLGMVASVTGVTVHNNANVNNIPVNLLVVAFGLRYTHAFRAAHRYPVQIFGQTLVGEADGFKGLYPAPGGAIESSNALAFQGGVGADMVLSHHVSLRFLQVDYVKSDLPDASSNVQNSLRFGAGMVFRTH